jgi:striatin 1/3/4
MLELALKQERVKYYKLKNGCDPKSQDDLLKPEQQQNEQQQQNQTESDLNYTNILNQHTNSNGIKNGRQLLKQYLQEIGYTDTIIDIRSTRLRTLLTNQPITTTNNNHNNNHNHSDDDNINSKKLLKSINDQQLLNLNNNNNNMIVDIDINEDDEIDQSNDQLNVTTINRAFHKQHQNGGDSSSSSSSSSYDDSETEDALKEFSFLTNENSTTISGGGSGEELVNDDWNVNKEQLNKLTEQYKKDRKNKTIKGGIQQQQQQQNDSNLFQRPNRSILQAMIANLNDNNNNNSNENDKSSLTEPQQQQQQQKITFNLDDTSLNLGELSRISVNNNDDTIIVDPMQSSSLIDVQHLQQDDILQQNPTQDSKRALTIKSNLRGHYDSIRCLNFHPTESLLLTGSEDSTVKLWCLDKSVNNLSSSLNGSKKSLTSTGGGSNSSGDIEPLYTFRGHTGAILSLVITQNGQQFLTSSQDCTIRIWNMPNDDIDQYDAYDQNIFIRSILGHTDCVWNLCLNDSTLVSTSSDSTIRIWSNPFNDDINSIISSNVLNSDKENGIPTSVNFIKNDTNKIICSFDSLKHVLYDIEYCKTISKFDYEVPGNYTNLSSFHSLYFIFILRKDIILL